MFSGSGKIPDRHDVATLQRDADDARFTWFERRHIPEVAAILWIEFENKALALKSALAGLQQKTDP